MNAIMKSLKPFTM